MELVANIWPIFDADTRVVQRFLARAYAMEASDETISATLQALAPSDFVMARVFAIPEHCAIVSEFGTLRGAVMLADFHDHQSVLLEPAFRTLEADFARLQGIATGGNRDPIGVGVMPKFPPEPYLLVTSLLETAMGNLIPQLAAQ